MKNLIKKYFKIHIGRSRKTGKAFCYNHFFSISTDLNTKKRAYTIYFYFFKKEYDINIYTSTKKVKWLNPAILTIIAILWRMSFHLIFIPLCYIVLAPYAYFVGCKNFIKGETNQDYVIEFHWANFLVVVIMVIVSVITIFKTILKHIYQ